MEAEDRYDCMCSHTLKTLLTFLLAGVWVTGISQHHTGGVDFSGIEMRIGNRISLSVSPAVVRCCGVQECMQVPPDGFMCC